MFIMKEFNSSVAAMIPKSENTKIALKFSVGSLWLRKERCAPGVWYSANCAMILERRYINSVMVLMDDCQSILLNIAELESYFEKV